MSKERTTYFLSNIGHYPKQITDDGDASLPAFIMQKLYAHRTFQSQITSLG
jgi:hypothetical protein